MPEDGKGLFPISNRKKTVTGRQTIDHVVADITLLLHLLFSIRCYELDGMSLIDVRTITDRSSKGDDAPDELKMSHSGRGLSILLRQHAGEGSQLTTGRSDTGSATVGVALGHSTVPRPRHASCGLQTEAIVAAGYSRRLSTNGEATRARG